MSKKLKKSIKIAAIFLIAFWLFNIAFIKVNTLYWGEEFKNEYLQTRMISGHPTAKVLYGFKRNAKVYYVDEKGGDTISFKKVDDDWIMTDWNTVWSKGGSADGIQWPFIFDNFLYTSPILQSLT